MCCLYKLLCTCARTCECACWCGSAPVGSAWRESAAAVTVTWRSLLLAEWSVLAGNKKKKTNLSFRLFNWVLYIRCYVINISISLSLICLNPSLTVFRGYVAFCMALFFLSLAYSAVALLWDRFPQISLHNKPVSPLSQFFLH